MTYSEVSTQALPLVEKIFLEISLIQSVKIEENKCPEQPGVDFAVYVSSKGLGKKRRPKLCSFFVSVNSNGQPKWDRLSSYALSHYVEAASNQGITHTEGIFIAPYISPISAAILREKDFNYLDLAGNCHLSFDRIFVERKGYSTHFLNARSFAHCFLRRLPASSESF